jgi:predicted transcriptional regulator
MKNRTHHDILAKVLQTAKGTDGITKTRIMYGAYLSSSQLKEYCLLSSHRLVSYDAGNRDIRLQIKESGFRNI